MINADPLELEKFSELAHRWWDANGEFKPLHDLNPLRLDYIDGIASLKGKRVLDIGCGGGILSECMAARGANVTGIDLAEKPLKVAELHLFESGAQVVQLFDTWAGDLARADYEEFALPYTQKIFQAIGNRVPRILYINGCATILESMARSGADCLSIDWRLPIGEARKRIGDKLAIQGNLDPCLLLGSKERMLQRAAEILEEAGPVGHIMNLGHGILPPTPVDNARAFIDFVKNYRRSQ